MILGALLLQGLKPGPELFANDATLVYSFAWSVILAGAVTFVFGMLLSGGLARMVLIPVRLLAPCILFLSVIGAYAIRNSMMDVFLMLGLGFAVYFLAQLGFHPGPIGLGVILGPIIEPALVQSLSIAQSSSLTEVFFGRPLSIGLIALTLVSILWVAVTRFKDSRDARRDTPSSESPGETTPESEHAATGNTGSR